MKIKFLKLIDRIIGRFLVLQLSFFRSRNQSPINLFHFQRILFIRPGGIGDAVLLLPSIRELKKVHPELEIDILCEKRNAGIFELSKNVHNIYLYDRDLELFRCLRNRYDVVIDTEQWHRLSAIVAHLSGATVRIGFSTNERQRLFTHRIPYSHDDYEVYSFFNLIKPLTGYLPEFNHDEPFIEIEENKRLSEFLSQNTVVIFPGATVRERRWGGERFGHVARGLIKRGYNVVVVGSTADKDDALLIRKVAPEVIDLTGKTSLRDVASIFKKSKLLISADSGLLHLAVGVGTPTVSLFGSGIEKKWAPIGKIHRIINKHLPCSPCTRFGYTPECKERDCIDSITPEDILEAADKILKLRPSL